MPPPTEGDDRRGARHSERPTPSLPDDEKPTLTDSRHAFASTVVSSPDGPIDDVDAELPHDESFGDRYARGAQLGEGGMGEVWLCKDRRVGRHVAMKVIRPGHGSRSDLRRRFLREVRVQGQLEHPSIVPVYDLGRDPGGAAYFTMKRVRGLTLEQVVEQLRKGDPETAREQTRFKRLAVFSSVCLAVHFAHTRGVVHRDLKPANVMLGDFGEVHVLDWGLAKVTGAPELKRKGDDERDETLDVSVPSSATAVGAIMGTPGYMAPEQVRGEGVGPAADVYALGAILYELIALAPLHSPGGAEQVLAATLAGADVHAAAARAQREVPPEIEAIVVRATALDVADRYESARAMQQDVERFLNGDRDLERRRELAREHAAAAADATEHAVKGTGTTDERSRAMREVSRAVALDPQNEEALETLARLLTETPRELPAEAREDIDAAAREWQRKGGRVAGYAYLSWAFFAPMGVLIGVRNWPLAIFIDALWMASAALAFHMARNPDPKGRMPFVMILLSNLAVAFSAGLFGPFLLTPALAAVNALCFVIGADRMRRTHAITLGIASFLVPLALEQAGIVPHSFVFRGGDLVLLPRVMRFASPVALTAFLVVSHATLLVAAALFLARFKDTLDAVEQRLYMHAWHLRQLAPAGARSTLSSVPPDPLDACTIEDRVRRHKMKWQARRGGPA
jgi:serine/threonine-protein kinase